MKYIVLYDTLINKNHQAKGAIIEFEKGTDEGYIKRLIANKIIAPTHEVSKDSKEKSQERIALEQKAQEFGISFKENTKDEVLEAKIAKALQSLENTKE